MAKVPLTDDSDRLDPKPGSNEGTIALRGLIQLKQFEAELD